MNTIPEQQFLNWLRQYDAPLYTVLTEQQKMLESLGEIAPTSTATNWFTGISDRIASGITGISNAIANVLPTYTAAKTQQIEIERQLARAKQGLPPLPTQAPANPQAPTAAEMAAIQQIAAQTASDNGLLNKLKPLAIPIGLGLVIFAVTNKKKGRR